MSLYDKPDVPPKPITTELSRNGNSSRCPEDTICSCCGSALEYSNVNPLNVPNYGYVCWISDTRVEEQVFPEFFIEVLLLEDGTFLVIKGNTNIPDIDYGDYNDD